jgi:hypothetical protein
MVPPVIAYKCPHLNLNYRSPDSTSVLDVLVRISASEIEAVLQDHPTVIGACVIGVADPKVGERIKAIVVLKELKSELIKKDKADLYLYLDNEAGGNLPEAINKAMQDFFLRWI